MTSGGGSDARAAPSPRHPSLIALLEHAARHRPERAALEFEGRPTGHRELWRSIEAFAGRLGAAGVRPREPVLLLLDNGPGFFAALYGCQRAGALPAPLFPGSGSERVRDLARQCATVAVVAPTERHRALRDLGLRPLPPPDPADASSPADAARPSLPPPPTPDDAALLQFTSGSTGRPKAVVLSHRNILIHLEQLVSGFEIDERDVFVSWLPCHHDMGLILMTMVPMLLGCRLILLPSDARSIPRWLEAIGSERGTLTAAPDFAYRWCLRFVSRPDRYDLSSLRVALNAAEPVRLDTLRRFESAFGLERVMIAGYGLAEACLGVSAGAPSQPPRVDAAGLVSVGWPFAGVDIAIVTDDDFAAPGQVGEIVVRSPAATSGYHLDRAATAALRWRDGYLRTGDLGRLTDDGQLFVTGRSKNVIVRQGRVVAPFEIEVCADATPGVARAAAIGVDRGEFGGETVVLFVELERGEGPASFAAIHRSIVNAVFERLGFRPARVLLVTRGTLPRTPNGKLRYRELREGYLRGELAHRVLFGQMPVSAPERAP